MQSGGPDVAKVSRWFSHKNLLSRSGVSVGLGCRCGGVDSRHAGMVASRGDGAYNTHPTLALLCSQAGLIPPSATASHRDGIAGGRAGVFATREGPANELATREGQPVARPLGKHRPCYTLDEAMAAMGLGRCQLFICIFAGLAWTAGDARGPPHARRPAACRPSRSRAHVDARAVPPCADAMEMMLLSFIGPEVHCDWGVTGTQEALLTSVVFVGMLIGSQLWGALADARGRKVAFTACTVVRGCTKAALHPTAFTPCAVVLCGAARCTCRCTELPRPPAPHSCSSPGSSAS